MMQRQPPRFVPTLTEVIDLPVDETAQHADALPTTPAFVEDVLEEQAGERLEAVDHAPHVAVHPPSAPWDFSAALPPLPPVPPPPVEAAAVSAAPAQAVNAAPAPARLDLEALVQAAVQTQLPYVMAQLQPAVEDAIRMAVLRGLQQLKAEQQL